nr:Dihydrofolate reductase [uncultured bacterium]
MVISTIVAVSRNNVIGKDNETPWYLPAELARFKELTIGHHVIMGRKTHESIGRALPGRQNIVVTRNQNYHAKGCEVVTSIQEALDLAKDADEVFIIGGAAIYDQIMALLNRIYLTKVDASVDGDRYFKFNKDEWKQVSSEKHPADEKNKYGFEFQKWIRKA